MQTRQLQLTKQNRVGGSVRRQANPMMVNYDAIANDGQVLWSANLDLTRAIGQGGQGTVFLADRIGADNFRLPVAVKVFSPEPYWNPTDYDRDMARMGRMAGKVARIRHENLIDVHHFFVIDQIRIMVMEWVEGFDLRKLLTPRMFGIVKDRFSRKRWENLREKVVTEGCQQPRLRTHCCVAVLRDCLEALQALHTDDIVHGDIKPANIMLNRFGRAKLVDIGSAFEEDSCFSFGGCTPNYAAPSILRGSTPSPATDLVSIGYVLIELLIGEPVFCESGDLDQLLQEKLSLPERLDELLTEDIVERELMIEICLLLINSDSDGGLEGAIIGQASATNCIRYLEWNSLLKNMNSEIAIWIEELLELEFAT